MEIPLLDRLGILIVHGGQVGTLTARLAKEKFSFTVINSAGGILQEPDVCLLVGFKSEYLPILLNVVRRSCRPYRQFVSSQGTMQGEIANPVMLEVEAKLGGARFYMLNVEQFEQI